MGILKVKYFMLETNTLKNPTQKNIGKGGNFFIEILTFFYKIKDKYLL